MKPILITLVLNNVSRSELGTYLGEEHSRQGEEKKNECKGPRKVPGHRIHVHFNLPEACSSVFPSRLWG